MFVERNCVFVIEGVVGEFRFMVKYLRSIVFLFVQMIWFLGWFIVV